MKHLMNHIVTSIGIAGAFCGVLFYMMRSEMSQHTMPLEVRVTKVEVQLSNMRDDIRDIKEMVKELVSASKAQRDQ